MFYVFLLLFCAFVFGMCFLVDKLIQRLRRHEPPARIVRQPRRAVIIGTILLVAGIGLLLFMNMTLGLVGGIVIALLGAVLLASYFFFVVRYDEEGFTCRTLKNTDRYLYNQIRGEQAIATRSGITVILYVGDTTVEFSEAMQGVQKFLSHAYYARCRQMGIDPDTCPPPAPRELVWFPEPPEAADPEK